MIQLLVRVAKALYSLYSILVLLILVLLVFPLILLTLLLPEKHRGNMVYSICRLAVDLGLLLMGVIHTRIFETPHDTRRCSIFIYNHISYLDALTILKAIRNQPVRGLGKAEMASIPLFGLIYKSAVIMVKRDQPEDRARSMKDMADTIQNEISVVIAPEGTFNETGKPLSRFYDGAFKLAIATGKPIRPMLFLDTYNRMHPASLFTMTPGRSRIVYLAEVPTAGLTPEDMPALRQNVYEMMEQALIRYQASWIRP